MTAQEIIDELKAMGRETTKRTLMRHGAKEPFFGVKIADMKKIEKRVKKDYQLALDLYDSGIGDAMYLAGLIADDERMTKKDLQKWIKGASWSMLSEYSVPWVATGSKHGRELALEWIESPKEAVAAAGWQTLSGLAAVTDDADLDLDEYASLLERVGETIHAQPNRVKYVMNGFVIAVGCSVAPLSALAVKTAKQIGKVEVDMGDTNCKVPSATEYLIKVKQRSAIGKKRKTVKC